MSSSPQFDILVFGASSFVGQILTRYLWETYGLEGLKWGIAARSPSKLNQVKASLGEQAAGLPALIADATNEQSLKALCEQSRLVVSTVGPYARYGEGLVKVCAETGTDYCDLTGEVQWMKQMIERYQQSARASGARLVHACGFDSIPSDLGVYFCQEKAMEIHGKFCQHIKMRVRKIRGGLSGGTIASMINGAKEAMGNTELRKQLKNPYVLCPPNHGYWARQHNPQVEYDEDLRSWVAPFVMSSINTRVVFRSNALSGDRYGKDFRYDEGTLTGDGGKGRVRAHSLQGGMGAFGLGIVLPPTRWALQKFVLPKPGEGPSPKAQAQGYYAIDFVGRTADGSIVHTLVSGDRDPGYGSTAKMLGQAAACLTFDIDKEAVPGGFWTPATAMNGKLIPRLEQHAGMKFELLSPDSRVPAQSRSGDA